MSQPPGPAGGQPARFTGRAIFGGAGAALGIMLLTVALSVAASYLQSGPLGTVLAFVLAALAFSPLIAGIIMALAATTPGRRGFGLGLAIGWALWLIVAAGACVALVASIAASGGG
ncbi:MAG TPA: hypothetical protein VHN80_02535 [Kineosporiaceae bacterium]|jgi:hypothetical protein|nr:hypothetical protein [Kineosporiaceae bacterium]